MQRKIIFALVLLIASASSGYAQTALQNLAKRNDINNPSAKPAASLTLTGDPIADLHTAIKQGGAKLILHLKQSYALASATNSDGAMVDPITAPCTKALVPIVDLVLNGPKAAAPGTSDPMALTPAEVTLAADPSAIDGPLVQIEKLRILRIALQSSQLTISCGPFVQDEVKNAKNLAGGITSLITGAGLLGGGL